LIGFNNVKNFGNGFNNIFGNQFENNHGNNFGKIFISFFLIIPFGICASIGGVSLYFGLGITVAKATVNFVDPNKYCPFCKDVVKEGEKYCNHCGKPLLVNKICKKCNTENELEASYCMNCGTKLD
jgi:ribosomal protein L40E